MYVYYGKMCQKCLECITSLNTLLQSVEVIYSITEEYQKR